jgi:hypothetical protein
MGRYNQQQNLFPGAFHNWIWDNKVLRVHRWFFALSMQGQQQNAQIFATQVNCHIFPGFLKLKKPVSV